MGIKDFTFVIKPIYLAIMTSLGIYFFNYGNVKGAMPQLFLGVGYFACVIFFAFAWDTKENTISFDNIFKDNKQRDGRNEKD